MGLAAALVSFLRAPTVPFSMQAQIGGPLLNLATRRVGTGAYAYEFAMVNKTLVVS